MDLKRVTVVLPPDLHRRLKYHSFETGKTLQQLYVEAVRLFLQTLDKTVDTDTHSTDM